MDSRFKLKDTSLPGVRLVQRKLIEDSRGYFERMFCTSELQSIVQDRRIVQVNHTLTSRKGAVRGMHFQRAPWAEAKFVTCLRGEIFDVAVDLRKGSPTFLRWHAEVLSADNNCSLFIPEGFAHGFQTCTENCELLYLHTAPYRSDAEGGLNALDPAISIQWPLEITERSGRDKERSMLDAEFCGLEV